MRELCKLSDSSKVSSIAVVDVPYRLQVIVSRAAGLNGGAIGFWFAKLFGVGSGPASATAIAIGAAPS